MAVGSGTFSMIERPNSGGLAASSRPARPIPFEDAELVEQVKSGQVEAYGGPGDVAVGISTSGNSDNVNRALEVAKQKGMVAVGLTGRTGGKSREIVDYCITVPSDETPRIQEAHILIGHILCELVEREIFGQQSDALYASDASERDKPVVVRG